MVSAAPVPAAGSAAAGARAVARCDRLGVPPYSADHTGLTRTYLSPAHQAAVTQTARWMEAAGLATRLDPAGNLVGRYEGTGAVDEVLLIGSHLDTVHDAGRYDGTLGVMLGVECVAALAHGGERMPFPIEVVAFGDEEGSRFPTPMLTSRALVDAVPPDALALVDRDGVSLSEALAAFGLDPASYTKARRPAGSVLAYLEPHIEQGPLLEAEQLPVGAVTGIAAQVRFEVQLTGAAAHAGTAAMHLRRDALAAAAQCVLAVEDIARGAPPDLVATVGRLVASPGAVNVVPGQVRFSLDVRAGAAQVRDEAARRIGERCAAICRERDIGLAIETMLDLPASPCDPALTELLAQAIGRCGVPVRRLVSGAGHDAMVLARLCPTAMLFLRCAGGVSHNPAEAVQAADAQVAVEVMVEFVRRLGAQHGGRGHGA